MVDDLRSEGFLLLLLRLPCTFCGLPFGLFDEEPSQAVAEGYKLFTCLISSSCFTNNSVPQA